VVFLGFLTRIVPSVKLFRFFFCFAVAALKLPCIFSSNESWFLRIIHHLRPPIDGPFSALCFRFRRLRPERHLLGVLLRRPHRPPAELVSISSSPFLFLSFQRKIVSADIPKKDFIEKAGLFTSLIV